MTKENNITVAIEAIQGEMRKILGSDERSYDCGLKIWEIAMSHTPVSPDVMHPLWLIWGALTDWFENKPEEKVQAEAEMRRAAREWLALDPKNSKARSAYLDRWVYDEMKYKRKE